ncbi:uncharacterized protein LACBIDRAFT_332199 [Laccaria bicolor S238N-H82]|uniref:Predicted protein n=1 Tax=Laccaria bicolor (strain S238N-H82 / ATCC MYA-4686) TaxID=486041 RepID=B0DRX6_LACBS|nr:uncharacterized protein LACBIDRAFT_332199 [Laccaria bicolor S238N-H82]EDR02691.1 predicted protein [Laccaria bicolor S238N-H82]|eukprot:XP_001886735.1 predicted protein [Laccaria bicolor S238N-H82]
MTSLSENDRVTPPPPLPIAAAHNPSNLRKLRKPIYNNAKTKNAERTTQAQLILSDSNAEKNILAQRTAVLPSVQDQPGPKLDLWTSTIEARESFNLNTRRPGYYPLSGWTYLGGIEDLMDDLREGVLLPYPPVPDTTAPRLPATDSQPNVPSTSVSVQSVGLFGSPPRGGLFIYPTLQRQASVSVSPEWQKIDDSTEEPSSEIQTPKRKQPVNRIWTAGSAKPDMKEGTPRDSFPMAALLIEPAMSLPSLLTSSLLHGDEDGDLNVMTPTFARRDSAASWLGDDDDVDEGD